MDLNKFSWIKRRSATLALIHLVNYIAKETDKRNMYACVLLCDISNAWTSVAEAISSSQMCHMFLVELKSTS